MTSEKQPVASSLDNYKPMMDERAELHRSKQRIEARIKELDAVLRPVMADRGEVVYNGFSFKVDVTAGRRTVDHKRMAADHNIDLEEYTKVGAPSTRFTIKQVSEL